MATEPNLKPTFTPKEEQEEVDEGEESDVYEIDGEEEGDSYEPDDDDDDDEVDEVADEAEPENMTALLLGIQNGTTTVEEDVVDDDEEDKEYLEEGEETAENSIDLASVAGSKRGVDELAEGDVYGDEDEDGEGETVVKKARV